MLDIERLSNFAKEYKKLRDEFIGDGFSQISCIGFEENPRVYINTIDAFLKHFETFTAEKGIKFTTLKHEENGVEFVCVKSNLVDEEDKDE